MERDPPENRRIRALLAAGAGVLVLGAGLGAMAFMAGSERAVASGPGGEAVKIELIAAVEPEPEPGEVMNVGEVADGFVYVKSELERRPEPVEDYWVEEGDDAEPAPPPYSSPEPAVVYPRVAPPEPTSAEADRSFGFDTPRRDYGAEREARRSRIEALALRSSERRPLPEMSGSMPPEAVRRSDSTFY